MLDDAGVNFGDVFVGVDLEQGLPLFAKPGQLGDQLLRRALHARCAERRIDAGLALTQRHVRLGARQRLVDLFEPRSVSVGVRGAWFVDRAGARHQAHPGLGCRAVDGLGFFLVDDGKINDTGEPAPQRLQEHPFGADVTQLGIQLILQRNPDPAPDLRRLTADDRLAEPLPEVDMRIDEPRRDRPSGTADHVGKCLAHPLPYPAAKRLVWRYMLAGFMALLGAFRAGLGAQHASVNGTPEIVMDSNTINWSLCCSSG
jgi:hypothetical protein